MKLVQIICFILVLTIASSSHRRRRFQRGLGDELMGGALKEVLGDITQAVGNKALAGGKALVNKLGDIKKKLSGGNLGKAGKGLLDTLSSWGSKLKDTVKNDANGVQKKLKEVMDHVKSKIKKERRLRKNRN